MEIRIAKTAGFCFGVTRAVQICRDTAKTTGGCKTLGPVIHNNSVGNLECFIRTVVFRIQLLLFQIILYVLSALLQMLCIKYTNRIGIILFF